MTINRGRLLSHAYSDLRQKCVEILLWGYSNNERGIPTGLFAHLNQLVEASPAVLAWDGYRTGFPGGAGSSTITKLAYFFQASFGGLGALILDNRLANEIGRWDELPEIEGLGPRRGGNTRYPQYLVAMHAAAQQLGCTGGQLELFLFTRGQEIRAQQHA